jgi:hypothetical protein
MKTQWWISACAVGLIAVTSAAGAPQNRGYQNDQDHRNRWQDDHDRSREVHNRFDDHDREVAREWYQNHRDYRGVRENDRLAPQYEDRLREGYVMDYQMRRWARPAPYELVERFGPPPPGYRYLLVNGHLVLVDRGYRVHDVIHFELNLGH